MLLFEIKKSTICPCLLSYGNRGFGDFALKNLGTFDIDRAENGQNGLFL